MFNKLLFKIKTKKPVIQIEPGIWIAENFISRQQCEDIIDKIEKSNFKIARQYKEGRHNKETFLEESSIAQLMRDRFKEIGWLPDSHFAIKDFSLPLEFYKYEAGDFIKRHSDAPREANGRFSRLTLVLYLSGNCEGGETFFDAYNLKVNPKSGAALLFEQHLNHEALLVKKGTKYVLRTNCFVD
ncbi:MAG TPA: 2OG-Fe(II) oxygenase [Chitinophagaceae bacterium]|nr:2OG-Fe(II) oxygenase [Chitinophagaceae bacterium]